MYIVLSIAGKVKKDILVDWVGWETLEIVSIFACKGFLERAFTHVRASYD